MKVTNLDKVVRRSFLRANNGVFGPRNQFSYEGIEFSIFSYSDRWYLSCGSYDTRLLDKSEDSIKENVLTFIIHSIQEK